MPWVEISQAAFTMGISERTIRNWIKSGKLNAKTENGRRLVEIPEEELRAGPADEESAEFQGEDIFEESEGEEGERMLDTQKRLEVALLECGRVKGTLASQERIMENLSGNIGELTAKLQKANQRSSRLVLWCVLIAFLGVLAVIANHEVNQNQIQEVRQEKAEKEAELSRELADKQAGFSAEREKLRREMESKFEERIAAVKAELKEQHQQEIARLEKVYEDQEEDFKDQVAELKGTVKDLREKLENARVEARGLEESKTRLEAQAERLRETLAVQAQQIEKIEEYKTEISKLQSDLIEAKKELLKRNP
jgi:chromosome segregation ATPase